MARLIERGLRESRAVDTEALVVVSGRKVGACNAASAVSAPVLPHRICPGRGWAGAGMQSRRRRSEGHRARGAGRLAWCRAALRELHPLHPQTDDCSSPASQSALLPVHPITPPTHTHPTCPRACVPLSSPLHKSTYAPAAPQQVWHLRVDVHVLDHCGNLVDAAGLSALGALMAFRRPDVTVADDGQARCLGSLCQ